MARPRKLEQPAEQPEAVEAKDYGTDAGIEVSLFLPGKQERNFVIRIKAIAGELMGSQNNPEVFETMLRDMVKARFGSKVQ